LRLKLDENLSRDVAALFTEQGHDVDTVLGEGMSDSSDAVVARVARETGRMLVTLETPSPSHKSRRAPGCLPSRIRLA